MLVTRLDDALAGGASSPVRAGRRVGGEPFVCVRGEGPYAFDDTGRRYVDYVMAYGPLLFGHTPPFLTGLDALASRGVVYGSTAPDELALARRIRAHLPSMERLRFATTGSEAVQSAVRVARAFTGRDAILKFSGNYHGHFDLALQDAGASAETPDPARSGIPRAVVADLAVARYNDLVDVDRQLGRVGDRLAAILVEPICGNMGLVQTVPGFLEGLRARADRHGALLIFDEVITWLRLGLGGAQGRTGVTPDLTAVGKVLGGGFPIAAFGGRADVMAVLAPEGPCFTGGTHAGMPFAVAIASRVLDYLEREPEPFAATDRRARSLADAIRAIVRELQLGYAVVQLESIVDFKFRRGAPTRSYDDQQRDDQRAYAAFYHAMRARGVLLPPSHNEVMFLSTAHSDDDIALTGAAIAESLRELRANGIV
ncbi:MAG: glutamate-1-semialdehyde 2,1-aminomutase [Candidatus Eremiobacteraeota bacterium]|nr:glutamate-1-semialdehyde 2,1-aminomutase [Candidatus Eremiobacteraeota bacterium]